MELARLQSIRISFCSIKGVDFPQAICKEVLKKNILPLCPVLEEALFTAMSSYAAIEQEKPKDGMELRIRRDKDCRWEF